MRPFTYIGHGAGEGGYSQGDDTMYWVRGYGKSKSVDNDEHLLYTVNFAEDDAPTDNKVYTDLYEAQRVCDRINREEQS